MIKTLHHFQTSMTRRILIFCGAAFVALAQAHASLVSFTDETTFDGQGTLAFDSTFNDYGLGVTGLGPVFSRGDVTYYNTDGNTAYDNLTFGTPFSTLSLTLLGNSYHSPILGEINSTPEYSMFGFEIANSGASPITFVLHTNRGDYTFASETVADARLGNIGFRGWVADSGEYFTGFDILAQNGNDLPGVTHVKLGNVTEAVPDVVSTLGLLGLAAVAIATVRRSRVFRA